MELAPISKTSTETPEYPRRWSTLERTKVWARRFGCAAATAAVFAFGGCLEPAHTEVPGDGGLLPVQCEPEYRLAGDYDPTHANHFVCGVVKPEDTPTQEVPLWLGVGRLCSGETAWMDLDVPEDMRVRIATMSTMVTLELYDPGGELVATINDDQQCLELDLTEGTWTLAAPPTDLPEDPEVFFEFYIDRVDLEL